MVQIEIFFVDFYLTLISSLLSHLYLLSLNEIGSHHRNRLVLSTQLYNLIHIKIIKKPTPQTIYKTFTMDVLYELISTNKILLPLHAIKVSNK